jgi:hypothetical protein
LIEVNKEKTYTDCTHFFGAKMYGTHAMEQEGSGARLTVTMKVTGPLGFFWRKVVAENIVKTLPEQTHNLVKLARELDAR